MAPSGATPIILYHSTTGSAVPSNANLSPGELALNIADMKLVEPSRELLAKHYAEHEGKPFYEPLMEFMLSGPVVAIKLEGDRVVEGFRSLAGATDPTVAAPGTIRGDLSRDWGTKVIQNLVHGSDSEETAKRELEIWF